MSEFFIQEKQLSSTTRTIVKDNKGVPLYLMVGHWGRKGNVLSLYAMDGQIVAYIKQASVIFGRSLRFTMTIQKLVYFTKSSIGPGIFITYSSFIGQFMEIFTTINIRLIILTSQS